MDTRWLIMSEWMPCELQQCEQEGKDVTAYKGKTAGLSEAIALQRYDEMGNLPVAKGYPYCEPNEYEEIAASFPPDERRPPLSASVLREKIRGAWYARIIGCELGKPVEGFSRKAIVTLAEGTDNYPIRDYIDDTKFTDALREKLRRDCNTKLHASWWKSTLDKAHWDDDLNYTAVNLLLLEKYGRDFTPDDVLTTWMANLPISATCTAEKVAYKNGTLGLKPPETARRCNPFREWVGAEIRADIFGYINPGNPKEAAHMAYKDACISHVKNGIYGEMFAAALISLAFYESDAEALVKKALDYIPGKSRLAESIRTILDLYASGAREAELTEHVHATYDESDRQTAVHILPNVCIVVLSLLCGDNDLTKALGIAVAAGFDTDSNGATVGSIIGAICGFSGIEQRWYRPFGGILETKIIEYGSIAIDELVERTLKVMKGDKT